MGSAGYQRFGLITLALLAAVFHLIPAVAPFLAVLEGTAAGQASFGGWVAFREARRKFGIGGGHSGEQQQREWLSTYVN